MASTMRLGIVDNDRFALIALTGFIKSQCPEITVEWSTDLPERAVNLCRSHATRPEIMLVDMSMGDPDGPTTMKQIRLRDDSIILIAMTSFTIDEYRDDARDAGAQAIVGKGDTTQIIEALQFCPTGDFSKARHLPPEQIFSSAQESFRLLASRKPTGFELLNDTENSMIDMCRRGLSSQQIADRIGVAASTVDTHLNRAAKKLGAHNRIELVSMWMEHKARGH